MRIIWATALLLAAPSEAAVISFDRGSVDILGDGGTGTFLNMGTQSGRFSFNDYSACDGQEEDCLSLPYGGRYANGGYAISITSNSLSFQFDLWQGTDIGGPLGHDILLEAFFISDVPVRLYSAGRGQFRLENGCTACTRSIGLGEAAAELRPDGRWGINFFLFSQANASNGGQRLVQEGRLKITEVPEPASWAMLIAGFGLVGAALRRRRYWAV
jgi:hypothetical protein